MNISKKIWWWLSNPVVGDGSIILMEDDSNILMEDDSNILIE